jgi:uncharacterized membrane protein
MPSERSPDLRIWTRLGVAALVGAVVGVVVPTPKAENGAANALIGFAVFGLLFCIPLLGTVMHASTEKTEAYLQGADPTRSMTDVVVVVASIASLAGVAFMLVGSPTGSRVFEAVVTIASIAVGWLLIHSIYAIRYARHWYNAQQQSVDFNTDSKPRFSDFAYLSFTLGMTYQVSDTNLKTPEVRKIVLHHTLLSYVFGTVIIAATINLISGLVK